jgi:beta-galactosidase
MMRYDRFLLGVCYYPEHWDASVHEDDLRRIAAAGFDYVRLGEGAWGYFEPEEGAYEFDLFDRAIDLCRKHKLKVIFGTPTYCAPAWVANRYPEVLRWNFDRTPMAHGSRRNFNYTSAKYIDLSDRICTALAAHYQGEGQIMGWQLDNEFNCHMDVSYAPSDSEAFRLWLKSKYKTLAALNKAWGCAFWSQQYSDWQQIDLPHPTPAYLNPHQLLDETRFISHCVVQFARRHGSSPTTACLAISTVPTSPGCWTCFPTTSTRPLMPPTGLATPAP